MQDRNLYWKMALIVAVVLWGAFAIWPPSQTLKGGIDLVGGHSLLYEIDTTGLKETSGLSTRLMQRLKQRVDPEGVRNLVWRPVGDTRLEIQMPLPSADTTDKRKAYQAAVEELRATNVRIGDLEQALNYPAPEREAYFTKVSEFAPDRKAILPEVVRTYAAWQKALAEKKDKAILEDLEQAYETQLDRLLATNVDVNAVNEVLEMGGPEQAKTLKAIADKYPGRGPLLNKMESAYTVWAKAKGPLDDPADLQRMLRGAGVLEFHILASSSSANAEEFSEYQKRLQERGPRYRPEDQYRWYEVPKPDSVHGITGKFGGKTWVLAYAKDPMKVLDKSRPEWKLTDAYPQRDSNGLPAVGFEFNEIGAGYFGDLTRNNIGNALCIILDEKAYSAPVIRSAISGRGIIEGKFSMDEVNYLVSTLNAGSLDARLKDTPIAVNSIGPSLGQDNRSAGFRAGLVAAACVIAFMLVYYLYAGLIADFALFLNILLILAMMAVLQATFTMAGIAGIILTIGMAVDANVLIFERMREEKEKLQSLRLIIKNGFDRALPTILDSNITTIITSIVLYYIGTEEVKGFALTLGLGLVINIFTAVFVTKVMFNLLAKWGMIKSLPMLQLIRRPNIDWVSKQKYFWGVSAVLIVMALVAWPLRGEDKYDIEFRGGTSVQIELNQPKSLGMEQVRDEVVKAGASLVDSAKALRQAKLVADGQQKNVYTLEFSNVSAQRLTAALMSFMEDNLEKGSIDTRGGNALVFRIRPEVTMTAAQVEAEISRVAAEMARTGEHLQASQVQSLGQAGKDFEIVTTATSQRLVVDAIVQTMGDKLRIQRPIKFNPDIKVYPITKKRLGENIGEPKAPGYVPEMVGGAAFVVDDLNPAVTIPELKDRLTAMRLQPDFEKLAWRDFEVFGLTPAPGQEIGKTPEDEIRYSRIAMAVYDPNALADEDKDVWATTLVQPEQQLLENALLRTSELNRVTQFAAQVASQTKVAAILAVIVSFLAITIYLWVRFGTLRHGLAANVATIHDIVISMGFVMLSYWLAQTFIGQVLLIHDFKLNLSMVAAILTLIGFSVNDTIVTFDRIRENQGKLKETTPAMINNSINQTLSRTILTAATVLLVMVIMYIFGGEGAQGFSFVMIMGTFIGCYSSIAIAAPMLLGWERLFARSGGGDAQTPKDEKNIKVPMNAVSRGA